MAAPRSHRPDPDLFRNSFVVATAAHGVGLSLRLRLLAVLIALVIAAVTAPFAPATHGGHHGETRGFHGVGRHGALVPDVDHAE